MEIEVKKSCQMKLVILMLFSLSCNNPLITFSFKENPTNKEKVVGEIDIKSENFISPIPNEIIDGWLKESIDKQLVIDNIGYPEKTGDEVYWGATGTFIQNWDYPSLGVFLELESESQGGDKRVKSITIIQPSNFKTAQGIGIGSEMSLVQDKYSKIINADDFDESTFIVGSIYGGIIFYFTDGVVSKIFLGAAAE
jgi:hypothetical protein